MSRDMVYEDVPRLLRREGDFLVAGANNTVILLGRDRIGSVDSGYGSSEGDAGGRGAGSIHMAVGRSSEDPSVLDDRATIYVSSKSDADVASGTESIGSNRKAASAILLRGDCVRIAPRTDFKVSVGKAYLVMDSSGEIVIEGDVSLGKGASERIIRGDAFARFWSTVTVPTPMGPSGPPLPIPETIFSPRNKVK